MKRMNTYEIALVLFVLISLLIAHSVAAQGTQFQIKICLELSLCEPQNIDLHFGLSTMLGTAHRFIRRATTCWSTIILIKIIVGPKSTGMSNQALFKRGDIGALVAGALIIMRPYRCTKEGFRLQSQISGTVK